MKPISQRIASELGVQETQVIAAIQLLDEGATVPFIARYRKELTGSLTDIHLRALHERLGVLRDLEERRETVLRSIREQEKLTPELERELWLAETRTRIEDLYLPFRPKRRNKATMAREAGLEPLIQHLLHNHTDIPEHAAEPYVNPDKGIMDAAQALDGARDILVDILAEDAELVGQLRQTLAQQGIVTAKVVAGKQGEGAKFSDYFDYSESLSKIPSHRALALFRGQAEGILRLSLDHEADSTLSKDQLGACEAMIVQHVGIPHLTNPGARWLVEGIRHAWRKKLHTQLETDLFKHLTEMAHTEAIRVFASNLKDLLLAAPAGQVPVIGLDPGLRTGVKVAAVDATGQVVATDTIYPHPPRNQWREAINLLEKWVRLHQVKLISIGNGTASRETDRLVAELAKNFPDLHVIGVVVSEAGASVYSASEYASQELPDLDVSLRGAVSIARRLQDPLAELVKIDPKSIGVGQYQHDVNERGLLDALNGVVEDAVNAVGVDVNTASEPLLERVSGLNSTLARNIVAYRNEFGPFRNRKALKKVGRFGPKTFELAAGFLRIRNGDTPLDASAVHPESYPVVERIQRQSATPIEKLVGNRALLQTLSPADFVHGQFGEPTVRDILAELEKPGRDPRPEFKTATFKEGVESINDLQPGMILEGTVTNVTNFGVFVDIGVHQDGLVHISSMANEFVKNPRDVTQTGAVVKVLVRSIDLERRRIALSMRLTDSPLEDTLDQQSKFAPSKHKYAPSSPGVADPAKNAMAAAFLQAATRKKR